MGLIEIRKILLLLVSDAGSLALLSFVSEVPSVGVTNVVWVLDSLVVWMEAFPFVE